MSFIEKSYPCEYYDIIPHSWKKTKIKHTINNYTNGAWGTEPKNDDNDIICIRIADFDYPKGILKDVNYTIRNIKINKMLSLEKGNLLIEKSGGGENQPVGRVIYFNKKFKSTFSNFITKIEIKKEYNPKFIYYVFRTLYNSKINTKSIKQTTGIQNLDSYAYFNEIILTPPLNEQEQIAKYLDNKTAKIEQNITKNKQLITLLKEKRTTLINQTVTKGLNPNTPMKESGIEWIGKIPENWEINKIKNLFEFSKGLNITKKDLTETGIPVISYGQIHAKFNDGIHVKDELIRHTNKTKAKTNSKVSKGDFIFADTSEDLDGCGNSIYVNKDMLLYGGYHDVILKSKLTGDNAYLAFLFQSKKWRSQIRAKVSGVKVYSINQSILKECYVLLPSDNEQKEIVEFLENKTQIIDKTIEKIEKNIELLEEYKESLIHHVVTGKIDVRGVEL